MVGRSQDMKRAEGVLRVAYGRVAGCGEDVREQAMEAEVGSGVHRGGRAHAGKAEPVAAGLGPEMLNSSR